ncbi:mitochondrial 37S ribosomal protein rsm10 [Coelomomyces lativittatus]|nr:mitochondrial 37S ribosomal protein rsm10 [Coelomomyces lativittatus]KAJ1509364.1 mitochondrial 37S ribosomal protein rsm10 [Coelomomyces lativittatus]KAJ1513272.1 mitochondrial 37S ribosomal protein rsm10 [Coelomomyces lativittatus]
MPLSLLRTHKQILANFPKNPVCEIQIQGHRSAPVLFYANFIKKVIQHLHSSSPTPSASTPSTNHKKKTPVSYVKGPCVLPRQQQRWTVLRSPFKYKRAQETFERNTYTSTVWIYELSNLSMDACVHYLTQLTPPPLNLKIIRYEHLPAYSQVKVELKDQIHKNENENENENQHQHPTEKESQRDSLHPIASILTNSLIPVAPPRSKPIEWNEKVFYQNLAKEIYEKHQRGEL